MNAKLSTAAVTPAAPLKFAESLIPELCENYKAQRTALGKIVSKMAEAFAKVRAQFHADVTALYDASELTRDHLIAELIQVEDATWEKTKSRTVCGVSVGFRKAPDRVAFEVSEEATIAAIIKNYPRLIDSLIVTKANVKKANVKDLTREQAKAIGAFVIAGDDLVFVDVKDGLAEALTALGVVVK